MRTSKEFQKASSIFYIVMGLLSFVLAGIVWSIPALFSESDPALRWGFFCIFVLYGIYRIYFGISRLKKSKQNIQV